MRFSNIGNTTVRFYAVLDNRKSYGAVRFIDIPYCPVRFELPLNQFFSGRCPFQYPQGKSCKQRFSLRCTEYIYKAVLNRGFVRLLTLFSGLYVTQASAAAQTDYAASKRCRKQTLMQASAAASKQTLMQASQVLLQARDPPQASAAASAVAGATTACGCCCCCMRAHPCRHASCATHPVIFAAPIPSRVERTRKEEDPYSRCGGVACTASIGERKLDRTSACWCWLLLTASAACSCCCAVLHR